MDSEGDYESHLNMKLHKINNRTKNGDLVRDGEKHRCTKCEISLSQYWAEDHLKKRGNKGDETIEDEL